MHSFATVLIAAALATLASAAPVNAPASVSDLLSGANLPQLPSLPVANGGSAAPINAPAGVSNLLPGANLPQLPSLPVANGARSVGLTDGGAAVPSVAVIFNTLHGQALPDVDKLTYIDSGNATVATITETVASIKVAIGAAIPGLKVLVGVEPAVILASVDGTVELTVGDVAVIVGAEVEAILAGAGNVLAVVKAHTDIVADVVDVLEDLGATVTDLVEAVIDVDGDITAPLAVELATMKGVIAELHLTVLARVLGFPY